LLERPGGGQTLGCDLVDNTKNIVRVIDPDIDRVVAFLLAADLGCCLHVDEDIPVELVVAVPQRTDNNQGHLPVDRHTACIVVPHERSEVVTHPDPFIPLELVLEIRTEDNLRSVRRKCPPGRVLQLEHLVNLIASYRKYLQKRLLLCRIGI